MASHEAITLDSVVTQVQSVMSADVGKELVVLHVEKNAYYDTDAIGADIWHRLAQPIRVRTLCDNFIQEYAVDPDTCYRDVLAFLNEAVQEDVVRVVSDADSSAQA